MNPLCSGIQHSVAVNPGISGILRILQVGEILGRRRRAAEPNNGNCLFAGRAVGPELGYARGLNIPNDGAPAARRAYEAMPLAS